jgi:hypothetical protein
VQTTVVGASSVAAGVAGTRGKSPTYNAATYIAATGEEAYCFDVPREVDVPLKGFSAT